MFIPEPRSPINNRKTTVQPARTMYCNGGDRIFIFSNNIS